MNQIPSEMIAAGNTLENKFIRLRDEWKAQRGHSSSTEELIVHPAYQEILGMGRAAVPFILRELEMSPDRWYWALRAITDENPVGAESRGTNEAVLRVWLAWGKENGYQW